MYYSSCNCIMHMMFDISFNIEGEGHKMWTITDKHTEKRH